ncbi:DUF7014 domain-containing protein, partial [Calothrix parietina]
ALLMLLSRCCLLSIHSVYRESFFTICPTFQTSSNLESGIPTVRNKNAGHGQGSQSIAVPQHFAAYQLHLTASTILFLLEAEKALT